MTILTTEGSPGHWWVRCAEWTHISVIISPSKEFGDWYVWFGPTQPNPATRKSLLDALIDAEVWCRAAEAKTIPSLPTPEPRLGLFL